MKTYRTLPLLLLVHLLLTSCSSESQVAASDPVPPEEATASTEEGWVTDFEAAKQTAEQEGKYMILNFTGSDWCGWCIKLDEEVFSKEAYRSFASENLVEVELDFPRGKKLPQETVQQNEKLSDTYGIRGYPTILILSPEGELVAKTGYRRGGAEAYVDHLQEIIQNHQAG